MVLEAVVAERSPLSLAELARRLELPKSSVLNICTTLVSERMLLRGQDGSYRLGSKIVELGAVVSDREQSITLIGLSVQDDANPFFHAEIAAAAEEAGHIGARLDARHAGYDSKLQDAQVRGFVDAGAEIIVVDPVNSQSLAGAAEYARVNGVTTVAINGAASGFDAAVTTDNTQAGFLAASYLGRRFPNGAGVAIIDGTRVTAIADRIDGFTRALAERGGFTILSHVTGDNTEGGGYLAATKVLAEHPDVEALFAINDPTACGASRACRDLGVSIPIVGVDGSREAVAEISAGRGIVATVAQDPYALARSGVRFALNLAFGARPTNHVLLLPTQLITSTDVGEYQPW